MLLYYKNQRSTNTINILNVTLQQTYNGGTIQDQIRIDNLVKPFNVNSLSKEPASQNAQSFINATQGAVVLTESTMIGFTFELTSLLQVTAFQVIAQYAMANLQHPFAIYDVDTQQLVSDPLDSTIDILVDPLTEDGFITHTLANPIVLQAKKQYVFVGIAKPQDLYNPTELMMQYLFPFDLGSGIFRPGATTLQFPTATQPPPAPGVDETTPVRNFGSFRLQPVIAAATPTTIFDVAILTGGYARFPPSYIRGLTFSVETLAQVVEIDPTERFVDVTDGFAMAQFGQANIMLPLATRVSPSVNGLNGLDEGTLEPNTFYSVFVIGSSTVGLPTGAMLSLGFVSPNVMPLGYNVFRRLGSVLTQPNGRLNKVSSEGEGATRTFYYIESSVDKTVFTSRLQDMTPSIFVPFSLPFIPSNATRVILRVDGRAPDGTDLPKDLLVRFRRRYDVGLGIWASTFANASRFQTTMEISLAISPIPNQLEVSVNGKLLPPDYILSLSVQGYFETL